LPELPEIVIIAEQMNKELAGKKVANIEARQPKNLNVPVKQFEKAIKGKTVRNVSSKGKWLFVKLDPAYSLLLNLGMGAELLHFKKGSELPENYHFKLIFSDGTGFTAHFWWFGYVHLVPEKASSGHKMTVRLGMSAIDEALTLERFKSMVAGKKTAVKSFLLDQKNLAGIGNVYVQDILFKARLHPSRKLSSLSEKETTALFSAIRDVLNRSIKLHGAAFERDFYGNKGEFTAEHFLVGYKTGKPCPKCGEKIVKARTGNTASYICPACQKLD